MNSGESSLGKNNFDKLNIQVTRSEHVTNTYEVSPKAMEEIRESCKSLIKTDRDLFKDLFLELVREEKNTIKAILDEEEEDFTIQLRELSHDDAMTEIQKYISQNPGCLISDVIENLRIDPEVVMEILKQLKDSNELKSKPLE